MKRVLGILIFVYSSFTLFAQNLVPNPGFELYDTCPNSIGQITYATGWLQPNTGISSTHYYNKCAEGTIVGVPHNIIGYQYAHTGNGYASISPYCACDSSIGREYVEVKLTDSLKKSKKYYVSFYVSLADSSIWATNNIQCYFSKNIIHEKDNYIPCLCSLVPQVSYDSVITDTADWTNISGNFIAQGGEQYLTIGNFLPDSLTKHDSLKIKTYQNNSGYYIDDVSVYEDTLAGIQEVNGLSSQIKIYPNPSNGVFAFDVQGLNLKGSIAVYNMIGEVVCQTPIALSPSDPFKLNLSSQPEGIYLYRVLSEKGDFISSGKLIIQ